MAEQKEVADVQPETLRALIARWIEYAHAANMQSTSPKAYRLCAEELEAVAAVRSQAPCDDLTLDAATRPIDAWLDKQRPQAPEPPRPEGLDYPREAVQMAYERGKSEQAAEIARLTQELDYVKVKNAMMRAKLDQIFGIKRT